MWLALVIVLLIVILFLFYKKTRNNITVTIDEVSAREYRNSTKNPVADYGYAKVTKVYDDGTNAFVEVFGKTNSADLIRRNVSSKMGYSMVEKPGDLDELYGTTNPQAVIRKEDKPYKGCKFAPQTDLENRGFVVDLPQNLQVEN